MNLGSEQPEIGERLPFTGELSQRGGPLELFVGVAVKRRLAERFAQLEMPEQSPQSRRPSIGAGRGAQFGRLLHRLPEALDRLVVPLDAGEESAFGEHDVHPAQLVTGLLGSR